MQIDNSRGCDFMDMKEAWKIFEKTGDIADYLEFCKYKRMEELELGKTSESKWNNNSRK